MKNLEDLTNGTCFQHSTVCYIATCDFDNKNKRLCINLLSGNPRWLSTNSLVEIINLYRLDKDNNIISIGTN